MADNLRMEAEVVDRFSKPLNDLKAKLENLKSPKGARDLKGDFEATEKSTKSLAASIGNGLNAALVATGLTTLGLSVALKSTLNAMREVSARAGEMRILSHETGISINMLRALEAAAPKVGMSADQMGRGIAKFADNMKEMARGQGDAFDTLMAAPLPVRAFADKLRELGKKGDMQGALTLFWDEIGNAYKSDPESARRISAALMGDPDLARIGLEKDFKEIIGKALRSIGSFTEEEAKKMRELREAFEETQTAWEGLMKSMTVAGAPTAIKFLEDVAKAIRDVRDAIDSVNKGETGKGLKKLFREQFDEQPGSMVDRMLGPADPNVQLNDARNGLKEIDDILGGKSGLPFNKDQMLLEREKAEDLIRRLEEAVKQGVIEGFKGTRLGGGIGHASFNPGGGGDAARFMYAALHPQGGGGGIQLPPGFDGIQQMLDADAARGGAGGRSAPGVLPGSASFRGGAGGSIRYGGASGGGRANNNKIGPAMAAELAAGIRKSAADLGVSERDLAAIISYETAGTMNPMKSGPTTRWGLHRGLIQWGQPQSRNPAFWGPGKSLDNSSVSEQMEAVTRYMRKAGVKPGMNLMHLYAAVNAGSASSSKFGLSDGYGTVASHTANIARFHGGALAGLDNKAGRVAADVKWPDKWERDAALGGGKGTPGGRGSLDINLIGFPKGVKTSADMGGLFSDVKIDRGATGVAAENAP